MKKGFTLIELLVVISIIALLSSVALASLNSARAKAADAAIKQNLSGIRAQAELYFENNGDFGDDFIVGGFPELQISLCQTIPGSLFADPNISAAITSAGTALSGLSGADAMARGYCGARTANRGGPSWVVIMPLKSSPNIVWGNGKPVVAWCVDSRGASRIISTTDVQPYLDLEIIECPQS